MSSLVSFTALGVIVVYLRRGLFVPAGILVVCPQPSLCEVSIVLNQVLSFK